MYKPPNCELTVHFKMKAELFADLALVNQLGLKEGQRFATTWRPGFFSVLLYPDPEGGRKWERRSAVAGGPLVGQARLRLVDPNLKVPPRFQPIRKLPSWVGWVGDELIVEFAHALQVATSRAVGAWKRSQNPPTAKL